MVYAVGANTCMSAGIGEILMLAMQQAGHFDSCLTAALATMFGKAVQYSSTNKSTGDPWQPNSTHPPTKCWPFHGAICSLAQAQWPAPACCPASRVLLMTLGPHARSALSCLLRPAAAQRSWPAQRRQNSPKPWGRTFLWKTNPAPQAISPCRKWPARMTKAPSSSVISARWQ